MGLYIVRDNYVLKVGCSVHGISIVDVGLNSTMATTAMEISNLKIEFSQK